MRIVTFVFLTASLSLLLTVSAWAENKVELTTQADKASYSVGYQMGSDFKSQDWQITPEAMVQGIQDAISGTEPLMSESKMKETLITMKRKLMRAQKQAAIDYTQATAEFLKENAKKEGVVVLPSGVQYKVIEEGTGETPTLEDTVRVHFKFFKVDGTELGSTYSNSDPRVVIIETALPGLQEVLTLMKTGAKYQIVLPKGLASNRESDDRGATIYEMSLISIKRKS